MAAVRLGDRRLLFTLAARRFARRLGAFVATPWHRLTAPSVQRILIAPPDLRTVDPTVAADLYGGIFVFSGHAIDTRGRSPFEVPIPHPEWARQLHGFGFLRHLSAAGTPTATSQARALVADWIALNGRLPAVAHEPEVAARRLNAFLAQSPMLVDGADAAFYRRFAREIGRQMQRLETGYTATPPGLPRLKVAMALATATAATAPALKDTRAALRRLCLELNRQILPDGGHVSRNPVALVEILIDLLPLRQTMAARGFETPAPVMGAIDRMMPMVRFFRHGDGHMALFNGAGWLGQDVVATVLAFDDARGQPPLDARFSGYQRLVAGDATVIVDAGAPPRPTLAREAHAGTLAFEFSYGTDRVIINCGTPAASQTTEATRLAARATAAHATATLGDRSSARFIDAGGHGRLLVGGPREIGVGRRDGPSGPGLDLWHDGYRDPFGRRHERRLTISADGLRLTGADRFPAVGAAKPCEAVLRFHVHPRAKTSPVGDGQGALIMLPSGAAFEFEASGGKVSVEESIFFADVAGTRRAEQIVVTFDAATEAGVSWSFTRIERRKRVRASAPPIAELPLPLELDSDPDPTD